MRGIRVRAAETRLHHMRIGMIRTPKNPSKPCRGGWSSKLSTPNSIAGAGGPTAEPHLRRGSIREHG